MVVLHVVCFQLTNVPVQFTVLTTLPPTPTPTHTHTHIPQRVDESSAYYQEPNETGQADHDTLHTAEAQVTSAESAPGQGVQYGTLSADGDSVDVVQGHGGEVTQGQSGSTW